MSSDLSKLTPVNSLAIAADIAGADEKKEAALSVYGFNLGLAFQMADDLLDYLADTQILGKNVGADLKEGKLTLPVIYTLKTADQKDREFAEKMITDKDFSVQDFEKLIELLKKYGGLQYTIERATENISAAKQALSIFKPSKTKKLLEDIADYALGRSA